MTFWFFVRDAPDWLLRLMLVPVSTNFFVLLSGFVLTYAYTHSDGKLRTTDRRFILLRITRIIPVYVLSLFLAGPVYFSFEGRTTGEAVVSTALALTLTQAWFPRSDLWWNGPAWYFSVMILTYAVFPFLTRAIARLGSGALRAALACSFLLGLVPALLYHLLQPDATRDSAFPLAWIDIVKFNPLVWLPHFAAGVIAGRMFLLATQSSQAQHHRPTPIWNWAGECAAVVILLVMWRAPAESYLLLRQGLLAPLWICLLVSLAHGIGPLARVLSARSLHIFGQASFGIFVLHMPLFLGILRLARGPLPPEGTLYGHWAELIAFVLGMPVVAAVCYRFFELPAIHRLRMKFAPAHAK